MVGSISGMITGSAGTERKLSKIEEQLSKLRNGCPTLGRIYFSAFQRILPMVGSISGMIAGSAGTERKLSKIEEQLSKLRNGCPTLGRIYFSAFQRIPPGVGFIISRFGESSLRWDSSAELAVHPLSPR